jgi:hypothetical protein
MSAGHIASEAFSQNRIIHRRRKGKGTRKSVQMKCCTGRKCLTNNFEAKK